jgi:peptidoglycan/LPS O-acetylase OafA/YrhL
MEKTIQRNSFDTLRLFGAIIVLIGHAFIITGAAAPNVGTIPLHKFGVCVFFAISGFLITQSWMSDNHPGRFLLRRILRIIPALIVVVVFTALVIGALATSEPVSAYFRHGWTWRYIISNSVLVTVWGLPGVFGDLPIKGQSNGSLWTLPIEFGLYIVTPILVFAYRRAGRAGSVLILLASCGVIGAEHFEPALFTYNLLGVDLGKGLALAPYFWVGSALRQLDIGNWPKNMGRAVLLLSCAIFAVWAYAALPALMPLAIVPICVIILSLGLGDRLYSRALQSVGDLSYGTYLWAFPIQQFVMLELGGGPMLNLMVSLPVVLVLAFLSWHLIERPALRLKPRRRVHPEEEHFPASSAAAIQSPASIL